MSRAASPNDFEEGCSSKQSQRQEPFKTKKRKGVEKSPTKSKKQHLPSAENDDEGGQEHR